MKEDRWEFERFTRPESFLVFDTLSKQPLGELVNLSTDGAMLVSAEAVKPATRFKCGMKLQPRILGHGKVEFELECRWSRKNVAESRWESGYRLTASDDNAYLLSYLVLGFKLCGWDDPSIRDAETVEIPNRRKAARFEFIDRLPVYEHRNYRQIGTLADLSVDGFRIITETPMSEDEILKCRLQLPKKVLGVELLSLITQCMWCRPTGSKGRYESGHKFVDVSKEDSAVLLHLMVNYGKPRHGEKKIVVVG